MPSYPDFYVLGLVDGNGQTHRVVVNDLSDTICLWVHPPASHSENPETPSSEFCFESEAYDLERWAEENGMTTFKHGYKYDQLGKPWKAY